MDRVLIAAQHGARDRQAHLVEPLEPQGRLTVELAKEHHGVRCALLPRPAHGGRVVSVDTHLVDVLPVAASHLQAGGLAQQVGSQRRALGIRHRRVRQAAALPPLRAEVDLDEAADVGRRVDPDARLERRAADVADGVELVPLGADLDGLVRVDEGDVVHRDVVAADGRRGADRPRIGHDGVGLLVGVPDDGLADAGAALEGDSGGSVGFAAAADDGQRGALVAALLARLQPVAPQGHALLDDEPALEAVAPCREEHDATPRLCRLVDGPLDRGGRVGRVALRSIHDDGSDHDVVGRELRVHDARTHHPVALRGDEQAQAEQRCPDKSEHSVSQSALDAADVGGEPAAIVRMAAAPGK